MPSNNQVDGSRSARERHEAASRHPSYPQETLLRSCRPAWTTPTHGRKSRTHFGGWWARWTTRTIWFVTVVQSPRGPLKLAMCCECQYGPVGHQFGQDPRIWLACDLLHQQDAALANNAEDFPLPQGVDLGMLQQMIESGMATVQFHVTFEQQRLGMCLADADEQSGGGVAVVAFTDMGDGSTDQRSSVGRSRWATGSRASTARALPGWIIRAFSIWS